MSSGFDWAISSIETKPSETSNWPNVSSTSKFLIKVSVRSLNSAWRLSESSFSVSISISKFVSFEASKLTNFEIDILTEKEDSERRQAEFKDRTETLIKNLEVDETLGQLLVSEGFVSIEEIAQSNPDDISKIDAIDDETALEL